MSLSDSSQYFWNNYSIPYFLSGILVFALGTFVLSKNFKSPIHLSFFGIVLSISGWMISIGFMYCARNVTEAQRWNELVWAAVSWISTNVYLFIVVFLGKVKQRRRYIILGYSLSIIFVFLHLNDSYYSNWMIRGWYTYYWSYFPKAGPMYPVFILFFSAYMIASFIELKHAYTQERESVRRVQIRWILLGFLIAYFGSIDFLPNFGYEIYTVGFLPVLIWMNIMAYAIIRHRLMEIQTVIHKTAVWMALSSFVFVPFFFIFKFTRPWLEALPTWGISVFGLSLFYLTTLYYKTIQIRIDQLFDRRKYDLRQMLDIIIRDLAVLKDIHFLAKGMLDRLCPVFAVEGAMVMIPSERDRFRIVANQGFNSEEWKDLTQDIRTTLQTGSVLVWDQYPGDKTSVQAWLQANSFALCIPLVQEENLIAIIGFGKKRNLKRFTEEEFSFLGQVVASATIAFSNSLLLERVRELDRSKTEFLSEVAHELRDPLLGISNIAEGILSRRESFLREDHKRLIENIRETTIDMKDLVDHLLDLSKIEMGVMTYEFQQIDLGAIVRLAVDLVVGSARSKGLELQVKISDDLPLIQGDKARIRQCVSNLLSNAIKYTDRGRIDVGCQSEVNGIRFTVKDTGRGMTEEEIKTVFERFRRGKKVEAIEGSGLGLTLTKEIIEAHGGKIEVESRQEMGSRFSFYLPGAPPDGRKSGTLSAMRIRPLLQQRWPTQAESMATVNSEIEMGDGEILVVIDDSEREREALRTLLENQGYRVLTATNGLEGLELIQSTTPHLIITDLIMPKLSGRELCSILKGDPRTAAIPIIMVTARDTDEDMVRGIKTGADDYLAKPYNIRVLSARISALLRMQKTRDALEKERQQASELEKKHHEVNSVLKNKNYLIMQLSHEVKTPLMALNTMVSNLHDGVVGSMTDRQTSYLADIKVVSGRIKQLLTTLLTFAMAEAGVIRLQPRRIELAQAIRQILIVLQTIQVKWKVRCNIDDSVQGKIAHADQERLEQIIMNLIDNAIKVSPTGVVVINAYENESEVVVGIKDSGPGIPKEQQAKILNEPVYSGNSHGSGLGLFISRYLVELHGGRIWFDTEEGRGTTFYFSIPKIPLDLIKERNQHVSADINP